MPRTNVRLFATSLASSLNSCTLAAWARSPDACSSSSYMLLWKSSFQDVCEEWTFCLLWWCNCPGLYDTGLLCQSETTSAIVWGFWPCESHLVLFCSQQHIGYILALSFFRPQMMSWTSVIFFLYQQQLDSSGKQWNSSAASVLHGALAFSWKTNQKTKILVGWWISVSCYLFGKVQRDYLT